MTHSPKPEQVDAFASRNYPAITMSAQKSSETPVGAALPRPTPAFATAVAAVPLLQPTLCESGFADLDRGASKHFASLWSALKQLLLALIACAT